MKKAVISVLIIVSLVGIAALFLYANLRSVSAYVISRATGSQATVGKADVVYRNGLLMATLQDISLKGPVDGKIGRIEIETKFWKWYPPKRFFMTDYDIVMKGDGGPRKVRRGLSIGIFMAGRGRIAAGGQSFDIEEVRVEDLLKNKRFRTSAKVTDRNTGGTVEIAGSGLYRRKLLSLECSIDVKDADLQKISPVLRGIMRGSGRFVLEGDTFTVKGTATAKNFEVRTHIFKKPLHLDTITGNAEMVLEKGSGAMNITGLHFGGAQFLFRMFVDNNQYTGYDLSSGFFPVHVGTEYVAVERIVPVAGDLARQASGGMAKLIRLGQPRRDTPFETEIAMKDLTIVTDDIPFSDIRGRFIVDEKKIIFEDFRGTTGKSSFSGVSGSLAFGKDSPVHARGDYAFELRDLSEIVRQKQGGDLHWLDDLQCDGGTMNGSIEIRGKAGGTYGIIAKGFLNEGRLSWRGYHFRAYGSYRFTEKDIAVTPLTIVKERTNIVFQGHMDRNRIDMAIGGDLDVAHLKPFFAVPVAAQGLSRIDARVRRAGETFHADGKINMQRLFYRVPDVVEKQAGVPSSVRFAVEKDANGYRIKDFFYTLDTMRAWVTATMDRERKIALHMKADAEKSSMTVPVFFFEDNTENGSFQADITVDNLALPLKRLPDIRGYLTVKNGHLKIPHLKNPLREVDMTSRFNGDSFEMTINRVKFGNSAVRLGAVRLAGQDEPNFNVILHMNNLDLGDFEGDYRVKFSAIAPDSILARTKGDLEIRADTMKGGPFTGEDLRGNVIYNGGKLEIGPIMTSLMGGTSETKGTIDYRQNPPEYTASIKVEDAKSGLFLEAFGGDAQLMEGRTSVFAALSTKGETPRQMVANLNGKGTGISRNGVIKRWTLLSRILTLLSLRFHDMLSGKIDLTKEGIQYNKMAGNFTITNGVVRSDDFIIDGPSILITSRGGLDLVRNELDAKVAVSPLVAVDGTIDRIPILRRLLREKDRGFLYVNFNVRGSPNDPSITIDVVQTIGGKAVNFLKNIFLLPAEVFQK